MMKSYCLKMMKMNGQHELYESSNQETHPEGSRNCLSNLKMMTRICIEVYILLSEQHAYQQQLQPAFQFPSRFLLHQFPFQADHVKGSHQGPFHPRLRLPG